MKVVNPESISASLAEMTTQKENFCYNVGIGLKRWKAAYTKVRNGTDAATICFIGDSITEGENSGAGASNGPASSWPTMGYVGRIRSALQKYGDTGLGFIAPFVPNQSPLWTFSGTGWNKTATGFGVTNQYARSATNGDTATLTFEGTGFVICYAAGPNSGTFTYAIDGGTATSVNANNSTAIDNATVAITGLTVGQHTIVITNTDATGKVLYLLGGQPTKSPKGVTVHMVGRAGTMSDVNSNPASLDITIDLLKPNLTIIALGANDYYNGMAISTYKANIQSIIDRALTTGDVLLFANGIRGDGANGHPITNQVDYVNALKDLAKQNQVALVDLWSAWGGDPNYVQNTLGFYGNGQTVHPNDFGHESMARLLLSVIAEGDLGLYDLKWQYPSLTNGWSNFGGSFAPVRYKKDNDGFVHLDGLAKGGTVGSATPVFTLPIGYRPDRELIFPIASNDAYGQVGIKATGEVRVTFGSNTWTSFSGITFKAEL
jgi:lysophospholipase L1-like esterase